MKIRDAVEKDLPAIVDIYNAAIPGRMACGYIEPVSVESRQTWYQQHPPKCRPIWVMEIEDKIVGWLSLQFFVGTPAYHATAEISIYIDPNYKRMGIGKKLLEKAISESSNCGIKTLIALIFAHNLPSLKLFERSGFQRWGYLPRVAEIGNVERDVVIMGLRVDEL
ncbi:MAG: N-acetyltransferase [Okeania sp. SIO2H7]|nr:N-acetyltransferase [Okeania sp. SIO2H7]